MIDGAMQAFALTLDRIPDHAARWHADTEVVTATDTDMVRVDHATLRNRRERRSSLR